MVVATVPKTMTSKFFFIVKALRRCFHKYALDMNWKPGKTEGILMWRGKRATSEKKQLRRHDGRWVLDVEGRCRRHRSKYPRKGIEQNVAVNIVKTYKHLGGIIEENGNMFPEIQNRCRSAMNSFAPLAKLIGSKHVNLRRRVNLSHSLIMSKLLFNSQTWEKLGKRPRQTLNNMYMKAWRRVVNDPRYQKTRMTDVQVRQMLQVASLDCALRKRRLLYFSRLTRVDLDPLKAILQQRTPRGELLPWAQLLLQDLSIMKYHIPCKLLEMPSPYHNLHAWWKLAQCHPTEWESLVHLYFTVYDDGHWGHEGTETIRSCKRKA